MVTVLFDDQISIQNRDRQTRSSHVKKEISQHSRMYHGVVGIVVLALKSEFAAQTHKKNTYFGKWATRKQSPHKKRGHTVELKFNLHRHLVCCCFVGTNLVPAIRFMPILKMQRRLSSDIYQVATTNFFAIFNFSNFFSCYINQ